MNYQQWLASLTPGQKQQISSTGMGFPDEFRRLQAGGPLMHAPADNYYESQNPFGALTGVREATARSRAAAQAASAQQPADILSAQQQLYQQSQNERDISVDPSFRDKYREVQFLPDPDPTKRLQKVPTPSQDPSMYEPGAPAGPFSMGGVPMGSSQFKQYQANQQQQAAVDREAFSVDAALGDPGGSPSEPFKIQPAIIQTLGTTPDPKQGPPKTAAQIDSANRKRDVGIQAGIAAGVGIAQAAAAFIPTEAQKLARETVDEWGGDAPEKYGDQVRKQFYEEGVSRLNLQAGRGREVQEDIAASAGNVDAGAQQDIRNAMMSAFTVGEAELQANATALGLEAAKEKTAKYNSAVAYVSQIQTARMRAAEVLLKGLAPVAAQFGVNKGIEVMSTDIAKLDPQYQDMFYNLSSGAKDQTELARAYAYVQRSSEKAAQAAAKAAADAATTQAATP